MAKNKGLKKEKKSVGRHILCVLKWSFVFFIFCAAVIGIGLSMKLKDIKEEAVSIVSRNGSEVFKKDLTTIIYDCNDNEITRLESEKKSYYLTSENIPQLTKDIFVVTEDKKFYEHKGVDYKSVIRAILAYIENDGEVTQGGSTITQQLAKNIYLTNEVTLNRKLTEMYISGELEERYTKDEILEFYINNIYFANGLYGVEAAAMGYFGKHVQELTISQMSFICAIPNSPNLYNPFENFENTIERRNRILLQLLEECKITKSEYEDAVKEEIVLTVGKNVKTNYVDTYIKFCATRELMEYTGFEFRYKFETNKEKEEYTKQYNEAYDECNRMLFTGGYRIYTSVNPDIQNKLQALTDSYLSVNTQVNEEGIYKLQGSSVVVDNETGLVIAVVGGRSSNYNGYTLNRAYQSFRQPGSSIKPILIYTPLFSVGYTPEDVVKDEKILGGPKNSPDIYAGDITLKDAIAYSKNTVAWNMFEYLGYGRCINYLLNMQFTHIVKEDYVPAMSIGGMTYGVSSLEMATAYAAIENSGRYRGNTCIRKIEDSFGNIITDNTNNTGEEVYEADATYYMTEVLEKVLEYGTGKNYQVSNAVCAAKTGTTNDNKDSWFVGYSRYYTTAVWVGYDLPKELMGDEIRAAGNIWHDIMESLHESKEKLEFENNSEIYNDTESETQTQTQESTKKEEYIYDDSLNELYTDYTGDFSDTE